MSFSLSTIFNILFCFILYTFYEFSSFFPFIPFFFTVLFYSLFMTVVLSLKLFSIHFYISFILICSHILFFFQFVAFFLFYSLSTAFFYFLHFFPFLSISSHTSAFIWDFFIFLPFFYQFCLIFN